MQGSATGKGALTTYGKLFVAHIEFEKGAAFIAAAILLDKRAISEPQEYVALHLFAQGIELLLKGSLCAKDFDRYMKQKRSLGHDLSKCYRQVAIEFKLNGLQTEVQHELNALGSLFSTHQLRYAGLQDVFTMPSSIDVSRLERKVLAALRLGKREFRKAMAKPD